MNHTVRLMNTAKQYIASNNQPDWVFAYAGGSVGRGDADAFSDLNLYIVLASVEPMNSRINVLYEDITIQLNFQSWEGSSMMRAQPWNNRFLNEARLIYDPYGVFTTLKPAVLAYFGSDEGHNRMLIQSQKEVHQYLLSMDSCIRTDDLIGASLAVQTAWFTAAYSLMWMRHASCSNSRLLQNVQEEEPVIYDAFRTICANENGTTYDGLIMLLALYRQYLSSLNESSYVLEPILDTQIARQVERMVRAGQEEHIQWLLRSQALRCYISVGGSFRQFGRHYRNAPPAIKHALNRLGFKAYTSEQLSDLLRQVEWLADQASRAAKPFIQEIS